MSLGASQVKALSGSLKATGAVKVVLESNSSLVDDVHKSAASFFKAAPAAKQKFASKSDAYGAAGYRALAGKQVYDFTIAGNAPVPDVLACTAPRAYTCLSAVGRTVLSALNWSQRADAGGTGGPAADLAALCEPVPLPPQRPGASLLSLFSYQAKVGAAAEHVDRGLMTIIASTSAGLEVRGAGNSWQALELEKNEVAILVGATLAAATGQKLLAAVHHVVAQPMVRSSVVLRMRGAPEALLPPMSVAMFEKAFQESHPASVNRNADAKGSSVSGANEVAGKGAAAADAPDAPEPKRRRSERTAARAVPPPAPPPPLPAPAPPLPQQTPPPPAMHEDDSLQIIIKILDYVRS